VNAEWKWKDSKSVSMSVYYFNLLLKHARPENRLNWRSKISDSIKQNPQNYEMDKIANKDSREYDQVTSGRQQVSVDTTWITNEWRNFYWTYLLHIWATNDTHWQHTQNHAGLLTAGLAGVIIIIIQNLYSALMPLGGYRGAGGTGR